MNCPKCGSQYMVKNGSIHNKKPKFNVKVVGGSLLMIPKISQFLIRQSSLLLKTPENFLAPNIFNDLRKYASPKINDLQTFPEFSVIDKLFKTRISLASICRATGVSEKWLYNYIITKYAKTPRKLLQVKPKKTMGCYNGN